MQITNYFRRALNIAQDDWGTWVPAERISRQAWQETVEAFVIEARAVIGRPAFGVSEAEISIHYHKPIEFFCRLAGERLGQVEF